MLIPLEEILNRYRIHPTGVIQVGSHWAEEYRDFINCGITDMVFIEPCQEAFDRMKSLINDSNVRLIKVACGYEEGTFMMNSSDDNQGQSNSILQPHLHLSQHPEVKFSKGEVVQVKKLDNIDLDFTKYQLLVMDCQGFEGEVIKGAHKALNNVDIVYSEVNRGETYKNNMLIEEMDSILGIYGLQRVETYWPSPNWTWGDAVWVSQKYLT